MSTFNEATLMITGGTVSFGNTGESPNLLSLLLNMPIPVIYSFRKQTLAQLGILRKPFSSYLVIQELTSSVVAMVRSYMKP